LGGEVFVGPPGHLAFPFFLFRRGFFFCWKFSCRSFFGDADFSEGAPVCPPALELWRPAGAFVSFSLLLFSLCSPAAFRPPPHLLRRPDLPCFFVLVRVKDQLSPFQRFFSCFNSASCRYFFPLSPLITPCFFF